MAMDGMFELPRASFGHKRMQVWLNSRNICVPQDEYSATLIRGDWDQIEVADGSSQACHVGR